jgi:RNA polymerase sigma-70 factor (ECF subfamily)
MEFSHLVERHYRGLHQFALSLTRGEAEAADLTQETFLRWAEKGTQLRDATKAKSWLYTTLYRQFLSRQRHVTRFPHDEIGEVEAKLPAVEPEAVRRMEGAEVMAALAQVDEIFRAPLALFYLEDHSYQEIAEILDVPAGTVMSRLWRGKAMLRAILEDRAARRTENRIIPMKPGARKEAQP